MPPPRAAWGRRGGRGAAGWSGRPADWGPPVPCQRELSLSTCADLSPWGRNWHLTAGRSEGPALSSLGLHGLSFWCPQIHRLQTLLASSETLGKKYATLPSTHSRAPPRPAQPRRLRGPRCSHCHVRAPISLPAAHPPVLTLSQHPSPSSGLARSDSQRPRVRGDISLLAA